MGTLLADPIAAALLPSSRRAVLGLLYGTPDRAYYLREIVDLANSGTGQIQRELARLSGAGIIRRFEQGRHVFFQADPDCPVYEELRGLVIKSIGAVEQVRSALRGLETEIRVAFIYGSVARGEEKLASDLDLMVVGKTSFGDLVGTLSTAEAALRREIHPVVFEAQEIRSRFDRGDHFLSALLETDKIFVLGTEDEFAALLGQPVD